MRTKIRGLVFVGFAATVFAQSALAVSADDKTVTSKTYVDTNFQNLTEKDPTTGTAPNDVTSIDDESTNNEYPTSRNVYKFVKSELIEAGATGNITGNISKHTQKIAVFETGYNGNATSPTSTDLEHLDHWELIVPDSVVAESGSDIGGTASNPGPANGEGSNLTTAQAVYDFVTGGDGTGFQRKLESGEKPSLGVYNADGTSVWKQAAGGTYVSVSEPQNGNSIDFDIKGDKIASHGVDDTSGNNAYSNQIVPNSTNLTTANAVYEYVQSAVVNGDLYQPKVDSAGLKVGVRTGDATNGYNSTWYTITNGYRIIDPNTGQPAAVGTPRYVEFEQVTDQSGNTTVYVDLKDNRILSGSGNGEQINQNAGDSLTTGVAVYNYAVPMNWTEREPSDYANKKLVTDDSGNVILADDTGDVIPPESEMPSACTESSANGGGHVCALVAYYDANAGGTGIGGVKYEWTVMAPTN